MANTGAEAATDSSSGRAIACAACELPITTAAERVSVNGQHLHEFMNPDGLRFELACFRAATGLLLASEPSDVWTWFPGFTWQIVLCERCHTHLGWLYQSPDLRFYGLIVDRVIEQSTPGSAH